MGKKNETNPELTKDEIESKIIKGWEFFDSKQSDKAMDLFTECANQGNAQAMNAIGYVYQWGSFKGKRDMKNAVVWYAKSAKSGFPAAFYNLGRCYFYGDHFKQNIQKAIENFDMASTLDYRHAKFFLANILKQEGKYKDISKSVKLYKEILEKKIVVKVIIELILVLRNDLKDSEEVIKYAEMGLTIEPENHQLLFFKNKSKFDNKTGFMEWIEENLTKKFNLTEEENDYPPNLALNSTSKMHVFQLKCEYHDEVQEEYAYDFDSEHKAIVHSHIQTMQQCIREAENKFGKPTKLTDKNKPPKGIEESLFENADFWELAYWTFDDRVLLLLFTQWSGDGDHSYALHAIIQDKKGESI